MSSENLTTSNIVVNNEVSKPKLWNATYVLTLISVAVASITMTMLMPLLPIYIKMINGNISLAGVVVSVFTLAALIGRPFFAMLIDKYGRKPILIIGFALITVGCLSYRFITIVGVLMIIRVIHGFGYGASTNATGTIVADIVPKEIRGKGIGYFGFVTAAALALGPATALTIMKQTDIKTAFLMTGLLAGAGLIAVCFLSYEKRQAVQRNPENNTQPKKLFNAGYEKSALPASLVMLFVAFAYAGIMTFLPTYAGVLKMGDISIFFFIYAVTLLITRLIVDRITKTRNISVVLLPGIGLMAVSFILLGFTKTLPSFLIAAMFFGVGYGSVQPTLNAIVISACPPAKRGAANSTFFSSLDIGIGLGALCWGLVSGSFGFPAIYIGCIAFMIMAGISLLTLKQKSV
jgi:predicted MFS family arabinose efflux permease